MYCGDTAAATIQLWARLNNDAAANYLREYVRGSLDTAEANHSAAAAQFHYAEIVAASGAASAPGSATLWIPNYAGTTLFKAMHGDGGGYGGNAAGQSQSVCSAGYWGNTAAVTQVTILPSAGNFVAGSRCTVYGLA